MRSRGFAQLGFMILQLGETRVETRPPIYTGEKRVLGVGYSSKFYNQYSEYPFVRGTLLVRKSALSVVECSSNDITERDKNPK